MRACRAIALVFLMAISLSAVSAAGAPSVHTNNWAVIVDTSRFWFNYRHASNALGVYRSVKRLGIPDSQIILMLADDVACNPRNPWAGSVYLNANRELDLYGDDVEIDYRGYDVTVENFVRVLTGRHHPNTPRSRRLLTDDSSNVLVFMSGHGGDGFIKFQDAEELTSAELADAFEQMWQQRRYHELMFAVDTCQAFTLTSRFYSPNIFAIGSSLKGENSYSHHGDLELGVAVIDRFTHTLLDFCERLDPLSEATVVEFLGKCTAAKLLSTIGYKSSLTRPLAQVRLTEFFGTQVEVSPIGSSSTFATGSSIRRAAA